MQLKAQEKDLEKENGLYCAFVKRQKKVGGNRKCFEFTDGSDNKSLLGGGMSCAVSAGRVDDRFFCFLNVQFQMIECASLCEDRDGVMIT